MTNLLRSLSELYYRVLNVFKYADGLAPLALRFFVGPVFIYAGLKKLTGIENTIAWFGNPDWGLGLPFPELLGWMAALTEFGGGVALMVGFAVRLVSIPLMVTMLVAAFSAHWQNGWQAVADPNWLFSSERVEGAAERLAVAKEILSEHGNYSWVTQKGSLVILNNGIEFSMTYFVMCLSLFFSGGGRYVSIDYWLARVQGRAD